jgi:hypothetical protein
MPAECTEPADCGPDARCQQGRCEPIPTTPDSVDLLFMVDNSNSMREEQILLAEQFPRFVRTLTTGDVDDDGTQDFPSPASLHVGVISSDMGTGNYSVGGVCEAGAGDDGRLRREQGTDPGLSGCGDAYPLPSDAPFLTFRPGETEQNVSEFARDFECIARLGTGGCGFEHQLEASLKAVTPSDSSIEFGNDTTGHADGANAGFLREGSLFALVMVTDEDDCSAADPELFNPNSSNPSYPGDLGLRCFEYPGALHPVSRYVDGLLATRDDPRQLVFSVIAGVPEDLLVGDPSPTDYRDMLEAERMQKRIAPDNPSRLETSCTGTIPGKDETSGVAYPPRRIVQTARGLEQRGAHTQVSSVCSFDLSRALDPVFERLQGLQGG